MRLALTASKSILEDLLEAQELEHRKIDCWVQSESTLVWTKRRVELNTVSTVYLDFSLVVFPCDAELDNSLWDGSNLESGLVFRVLLKEAGVLEGGGKL
jgi:hypothetical protein